MTKEELNDLLNEIQKMKSESRTLELKAAHFGCPKRLYDTLSSFSNQDDGGIIVFGVDEQSGYQEVGVYDAQDLQKQVNAQCLQMEPVVRPVLTVAEKNQKYFVSAEIPGMDLAERPCYYRGVGRIKGSYIRVGDSDEPMTEYEVYSYEAFRRQYHDELRVVEDVTLSDLDELQVKSYVRRLQAGKPHLAQLPLKQVYRLANILRDGKATIWSTLMFSPYPQAYFPQLSITAVVIPGEKLEDIPVNGPRFLDNERITGNIQDMLQGALRFVERNLRKASYINAKTGLREDRLELPLEAIREAIVNALAHRDYSVYTEGMPIQIKIFTNRLEIHSPGGLYGRLTVDQLGHVQPDTRNPVLVTAMELLGMTENRYTGIPIMQRRMRENNLPAVEFENSRGTFIVTFTRQQIEAKNVTDVQDERNILAFCQEPRTRKEIAQYLGIETVAYVMSQYIRPLLEAGKLKQTIPEKPRSSKQRYYAV